MDIKFYNGQVIKTTNSILQVAETLACMGARITSKMNRNKGLCKPIVNYTEAHNAGVTEADNNAQNMKAITWAMRNNINDMAFEFFDKFGEMAGIVTFNTLDIPKGITYGKGYFIDN